MDTITTGRIRFPDGAAHLKVRHDEHLTGLYEARFTSPRPTIRIAGTDVTVAYPLGSRLLRRTRPSTVTLNPRLAWDIEIRRGASNVELLLGRPHGQWTITVDSASDLALRRPADVPVRVEIGRGVTRLRFDHRRYGAVGGRFAEQTAGYESATDRYLLVVTGGAKEVTIDAHA